MTGMEKWSDRVAFVTGASEGIGAVTAQRLVREGMRVVGCARRLEKLRAVLSEADPSGERTMAVGLDLREESQILDCFEQIRVRWGGVDVLVNNAGFGHHAPLLSGETELWRDMFEVNVIALCVCTREAVQDMQRRGVDGHIIHVSSMAAHRVPGGSGVYSATKFAVRSLTEGLRAELHAAKSPIRVSALSPGFVETGFAAHYSKSEERARQTYSRYKVLEAQDMAETILYLLSCPPHMQVHDVLIRPTEQPD